MFFNNTLFKPVAIHSIFGAIIIYRSITIVTYIIIILEIIIGKEHYNYD